MKPKIPNPWHPLSPHSQSPLRRLQGLALQDCAIRVYLGPTSRYGARYFRLRLRRGRKSRLLLQGLHGTGTHPAQTWIEVYSLEGKGLTKTDLASLFRALGELIPPGGHLMAEYDSPQHRETARGLALGVPPAATPLGYLLFRAGCGVTIRDWYHPEGGREGNRKLQGFKALNLTHARRGAQDMAHSLRDFLARAAKAAPLLRAARRRALAVLETLPLEEEVGRETRRTL